jgi:hypothetical protein
MATKTWKIGECCKGGIITVEIKGKDVAVIGKRWDHSAGDRRSSNQNNAKEWTRETVNVGQAAAYQTVRDFLEDLTTSYYAGEIIKWIETKVTLNAFGYSY